MSRANKVLATGKFDQKIYKNAKAASDEMGLRISRIRTAIADGREMQIGSGKYCLDYLFEESDLYKEDEE